MAGDELLAAFGQAQAAFTERVHAVGAGQWALGTPDTEWTVADLVGHLVDEHRWAGPLLAGQDMATAGATVARMDPAGPPGPALVRAWDAAAADSASAFGQPGALRGPVAITRGTAPAGEYLEEMVLDLVVHTWDLGTATGYAGPLPAAAIAAVYPLTPAIVARTPAGMFAPAVPADPAAPVLDRLLALTGRVSRRSY